MARCWVCMAARHTTTISNSSPHTTRLSACHELATVGALCLCLAFYLAIAHPRTARLCSWPSRRHRGRGRGRRRGDAGGGTRQAACGNTP